MTAEMQQHTPGPWDYDEDDLTIYSLAAFDADFVTGTDPFDLNGRRATAQNRADARLFAAAPDLLDALKLAIQYLNHPDVQALQFALHASVAAARAKVAIDRATD